ncbi:MAG: hypothetical protein MI747_13375 [Desulfobacterales bacterium]|nr:hypothetical protein [Desulfobacterales bacterium]
MKFITEVYLRGEYRKAPFTEFVLEEGLRLTPGAREFLSDRRIELCTPPDPAAIEEMDGERESAEKEQMPPALPQSLPARWGARLASLENLFLITAQELSGLDVNLSREILELFPTLAALRNADSRGEGAPFSPCTGMDEAGAEMGNCFDLAPFHLTLACAPQLLKLDRLRCAVNEVKVEAIQDARTVEALNCLINRVSQLICTTLGGNECQRKS